MNALIDLFQQPAFHRVGWVLVHFLWQGAGIGMALAVLLRVLNKASSHLRYLVICAALFGCGIAPVITWAVLVHNALPSDVSREPVEKFKADGRMDFPLPPIADVAGAQAPTAGTPAVVGEKVTVPWRVRGLQMLDGLLPYAVAFWFAGVLVLTLRLALGWMQLQRLRHSGTAIFDPAWQERFRHLAERMRVSAPVRLVTSTIVEVPTLIGWLRPVILLPASIFTGLTIGQLEAVLAHELAHVRRYDYLVNLLQTAVETVLFYHPAVWWISRKLREEREDCCDDIAVETMQDRAIYASALAALEEGRPAPSMALAASGGSLLGRIGRIAGVDRRRSSLAPVVATLLILGSLITPLAHQLASGVDAKPAASPSVMEQKALTAIKKGNAAALQKLIEQGVDPNKVPSGDGLPLLFHAASAGVVEILIQHGADPNAGGTDKTPLSAAPDAESVRLLVQHGANLKPKFEDGSTLIESAINRHADVIEELIKQGAEFDPKGNGINALVIAAYSNQVEAVRVFLDHGVSPNAVADATHWNPSTPIGLAATEGATDTLKLLLARGANPSGDPIELCSPLSGAVSNGSHQIEELLRKAGARDVGDLSSAAARGDLGKVAELLKKGADVNETDRAGQTPLSYALRRGQVDAAKLLLENGASVNVFDRWGSSPWLRYETFQALPNIAFNSWNVPMEEVTRRQGAFKELFDKQPFDPNYKDSHGRTALQQAAFIGNIFTVQWLLSEENKHPVDPNLRDADGRPPILLAALSLRASETRTKVTEPDDSKIPNAPMVDWDDEAYIAHKLIQAGAKLNLPMPGGKTVGELALEAARKANNPQLVSVLEAAGGKAPPTKPATPDAVSATPTVEQQIIVAVNQSDAPAVQKLLALGADPNMDHTVDAEPLLFHAKTAEVAEILIQYGADPNMHDTSVEKDTALSHLWWAPEKNEAAILRVLLDHGADPNAGGTDDAPLSFAPDAESVRLLVQYGANPRQKMNDGSTLIESAISRHADVIEELIKQGAEFDPKGNGVNALWKASGQNNVEAMRVFLDHGVSPNAVVDSATWNPTTPIFAAALGNAIDALKLLLARGANPAGDPSGISSPLGWAVSNGNLQFEELLRKAGAHDVGELSSAAARGDIVKVAGLLKKGADVNETDHAGQTPLSYALHHGQPGAAKLLFENGANVNIIDRWGMAPWCFHALYQTFGETGCAAKWKVPADEARRRLTAFKELFDKHPPDPGYKDSQGRTLLQEAAFIGNCSTVQYLLSDKNQHPVDPNLRDADGRPPILLAALSVRAPETWTKMTEPEDSKIPNAPMVEWNVGAYIAHKLIQASAKLDLPMPGGKTVGELALKAARNASNAQLISVLEAAGAKAPPDSVPALPAQTPSTTKGSTQTLTLTDADTASSASYLLEESGEISSSGNDGIDNPKRGHLFLAPASALSPGSPSVLPPLPWDRAGSGIGVRLDLPVGPVRVDFPAGYDKYVVINESDRITPLCQAVKIGSLDTVKSLVERGADVNEAGDTNRRVDGWIHQPLAVAAYKGEDEIVEYLLKHGATHQFYALYLAVVKSRPDATERSREHFERAAKLLIDAGALKGLTGEQAGMLLEGSMETASGEGNPVILKMLLDAGLSPVVPMPSLAKYGRRPTVIEHFTERYNRIKESSKDYDVKEAAKLKPLLDLIGKIQRT